MMEKVCGKDETEDKIIFEDCQPMTLRWSRICSAFSYSVIL